MKIQSLRDLIDLSGGPLTVAYKAGVSVATIYNVLRGDGCSRDTFENIADVLGIGLDEMRRLLADIPGAKGVGE